MDYIKVFKEIVDIMHNDYSGCIDKRDVDNPDQFLNEISLLVNNQSINKRKFFDITERYLLAFKDYHIGFFIKGLKPRDCEIKVRRYQDALYVTQSNDPNFKIGDKIIKLGKDTILKARQKYSDYFFESVAERENWQKIVCKYKSCTVEGVGVRKLNRVEEFNYSDTLNYQAKAINENTLYIKLPHFLSESETNKLINENKNLFEVNENLIIDVRVNLGGNDTNFFPFLKYILPLNTKLSPLLKNTGGMKINYSKRNCEGRLAIFNSELKIAGEANKKFLTALIDDVNEKFGKGFLSFDVDDKNGDCFDDICGQALPKKVVVLSDYYCGSSGDAFVEICKMFEKVVVIGRPTMGISDYGNLNIVNIDGLKLYYPTSRIDAIDSNEGLNYKGVPPHIYVPWTPSHLKTDIDLEYALKYLNQTK